MGLTACDVSPVIRVGFDREEFIIERLRDGAIEWMVAVAGLSNSSCVTITHDIDHNIENYYVARLKNRDTIQQ